MVKVVNLFYFTLFLCVLSSEESPKDQGSPRAYLSDCEYNKHELMYSNLLYYIINIIFIKYSIQYRIYSKFLN